MDSEERIISPVERDEEFLIENSLRPRNLGDFVGQTQAREHLSIGIEAAKQRREALDHVLLYGPPGLGKTTLAQIVANEMGSTFRSTAGPAIEKRGDLAAILTNISEADVLFIDEIHRLHPAVEEILYPAMEDFQIDIIIGEGAGARSIKIDIPHFTLVGATTRTGLLTSPLRARFGIIQRLDFYDRDNLVKILIRSAGILGVAVERSGAEEIARRSRGTPRIANRLLRRVRDFAQVKSKGTISREIAAEALELMNVDQNGLDDIDRRLLIAIIEKFNGGPVGLSTISAAISEEKDAIEDIYEPYLIQMGFLHRTPRGRVATKSAYEHLGIPLNPGAAGLFDL